MSYELEDEFGDIIKKARKGLNLSIERLAQDTQILHTQISKMESYSIKPTAGHVDRLAKRLGLSAKKLQLIAEENWSPKPIPIDHDSKLSVLRISNNVNGWPVHAYVLKCEKSKQLAIIDTAANPKMVIERVKGYGLPVSAILLTHAHQDHVGGLSEIQQVFGAPTYIHRNEPQPTSKRALMLVSHGDIISVGALSIRVLDIPGHTAGGCAFQTRNTVFAGDSIFAGSVGNAFLAYDDLLNNIRKSILSLPNDTYIFPGHGPSTTVGEEKAHNPFFAEF